VDLSAFIRPLVQQGHAIIVMLDANENIDSRHSRLEAFRQDLDLVDLHTYRHGYADEPETHQRNTSGQRIDYILATASVAACLLQAGIEAYSCNEYSSDHRGLFIDIDAEALLQGHIAELDNANGRGISSSSPKTIAKYKQLVLQYFDRHRISDRIKDLATTMPDQLETRLNAIDRDISRALISAETCVRRQDPAAFSTELQNALRTQHYWRLWYKETKTKRDLSSQRESI
jgi:hypothetical protein